MGNVIELFPTKTPEAPEPPAPRRGCDPKILQLETEAAIFYRQHIAALVEEAAERYGRPDWGYHEARILLEEVVRAATMTTDK
jgi:hypothetical protein